MQYQRVSGTLADHEGTQPTLSAKKYLKFQCIPGGDGIYLPIAAASILAKVSRDNYVKEWCSSTDENKLIEQQYKLLKNKGYGTSGHREGLKTHGAHEQHRKQFIRNWI